MIIGYAYVVGDILHAGHIHHLRNCWALCDKLFVGVLTDRATMEKKPKPILSLEERMLIIRSLRYVDVVVAQDTYSPMNNVKAIKSHILFESSSHDKKEIERYEHEVRAFGEVIVMPYYPDQSSTMIKTQIKDIK